MQIPSLVQIETTNKCPAKCPFCARNLMERQIGDMTDELFNKVINELAKLWSGVTYATAIHPNLNGDCFCDPKIFDRMKIINEKLPNTKIGIYTNGYLLNEEYRNKLLEIKNIGTFRLSLNYIGEDYERNMGLKWDVILENFRALRDLHKEHHFADVFRVGTVDDEEHPENNTKFIDFVTKEGFTNPNTSADLSYSIAFKENWLGKIETKNTLGIDLVCRFLNHLCILYNGAVSLCCFDNEGEYELGNLNNQTISEVYNGEKRMKYLIGVKRDHVPCKFCNTR